MTDEMPESDGELSEYLVGRWSEIIEAPGMVITTEHIHDKDGSWTLVASANYDGVAGRRDTVTGRWTIRDGCLTTTVETSEIEDMRKGDTYREEILIATAGELHLMVGADGETTLRTRLPG